MMMVTTTDPAPALGVVVASTPVDASVVRRHEARTRPDWSLLGSIRAVQRFVATLAGHTADGHGGLAELAATADAARELADVVDVMARHLLDHDDASYREIGIALGITAQAAQKRYPAAGTRRPGGQPSHLR